MAPALKYQYLRLDCHRQPAAIGVEASFETHNPAAIVGTNGARATWLQGLVSTTRQDLEGH